MLRLPLGSQIPFTRQIRIPTSFSHQISRPFFNPAKAKGPFTRPRLYATMSQSHACCTVPPVVSDGYKEKGEHMTIDGMKTYVTGSKDAKSAILVVYDIFGFFPQTYQGADILAYGDKEKQYQVFMPGG